MADKAMWEPKDTEKLSDQEFMDGIYQEFNRLMFSTVKKYVADRSDREDIVQSSLVKLMGRISVLRTLKPASLACYIVYTVKSASVDFLRAKARSEDHIVGLWDLEAEQIESLDEWFDSRESVAQLKGVWSLLPQEDQQLLWGKYIGGYTDEELAQDFGCKPGSVRMKLTRARRRAFDLLSGKEGR